MMSWSFSSFLIIRWLSFFLSTRSWSFNYTFNKYIILWRTLWSRFTIAFSTKSKLLKNFIFDWTTRHSTNFEIWITLSSFKRWTSNLFSVKHARSTKTSTRTRSLTINILSIVHDARDCKFSLQSTIWISNDAAEIYIIIVNSFVLCNIAFASE